MPWCKADCRTEGKPLVLLTIVLRATTFSRSVGCKRQEILLLFVDELVSPVLQGIAFERRTTTETPEEVVTYRLPERPAYKQVCYIEPRTRSSVCTSRFSAQPAIRMRTFEERRQPATNMLYDILQAPWHDSEALGQRKRRFLNVYRVIVWTHSLCSIVRVDGDRRNKVLDTNFRSFCQQPVFPYLILIVVTSLVLWISENPEALPQFTNVSFGICVLRFDSKILPALSLQIFDRQSSPLLPPFYK